MNVLSQIQAAAAKAEKTRKRFVPEWKQWITYHRLSAEEGLAFVRRHRGAEDEGKSEPEKAAAIKAQQVDLIALTAHDDAGAKIFDDAAGRAFLASKDVDFATLNRCALDAMGLNGLLKEELAAEKNSSTISTTPASSSSGS